MKNSILQFATEELDEFIVPNYFSKKISVYDIVKTYAAEYFDVYRINDNDKFERISYELYGTTDYWDLLMLINERNPLFDAPYDYDTIKSGVDSFLTNYINFTYSQAPLSDQTRINALTTHFNTIAEENNETNRFIYVIKNSRLGDFIKILKDNNYI